MTVTTVRVHTVACDRCGATSDPEGWVGVRVETRPTDASPFHRRDLCLACSTLFEDFMAGTEVPCLDSF